ncbi:hypothetical protein BHM03_00046936 [Ensete ventricosum]|nr:hypothetical protein BHM03_00046936 [Ensete ventricosum]
MAMWPCGPRQQGGEVEWEGSLLGLLCRGRGEGWRRLSRLMTKMLAPMTEPKPNQVRSLQDKQRVGDQVRRRKPTTVGLTGEEEDDGKKGYRGQAVGSSNAAGASGE